MAITVQEWRKLLREVRKGKISYLSSAWAHDGKP